MLDWSIQFAQRYAVLFVGLTLLSVVSAAVMVAIGVRLISRLPPDYFVSGDRHYEALAGCPGVVRFVVPLIKNLLGFVFVVGGIVMLVLPGQGILTLVAGILLMDFPGKFALERRLVAIRRVRGAVDWLRQRAGEPPLILDRNRG